jgi:hypothetical protein
MLEAESDLSDEGIATPGLTLTMISFAMILLGGRDCKPSLNIAMALPGIR